ncbi:MAG TPA: AMP-binding protein [Acidimicrobiales bacterium]|nr:AMP-binding protein [Acidimicrobiales bacterium]
MSEVAPPRTFNFADVWEYAADRVPEREALVCGARRLTYEALENRANRFAAHLSAAGVTRGDTFGIFAPNCTEWIEAQLAGWKLGALPMNVNHRYGSAELAELLDDARAVGLVFDRALSDVVAGLGTDRLASLGVLVAIDLPESAEPSGPLPATAVTWDEVQHANAGAERPRLARDGEDRYLIYTGGTTGHPKGVVWRQEDAFYACFGGGDPMRMNPVTEPAQLADHIMESPATYLCIAPLMHAAGQWVATSWLWAGSRVVLVPGSFDPETIWDLIDAEQINLFTVVGDATGKPLMDCWDANPGRWQASSVFSISNGGAPMSPVLKARFISTFPDQYFVDGFGSSETGAQGSQRIAAAADSGDAASHSGVARFAPYGSDTAVLDDALRRVTPGSGATGRVALKGRIPIGYLHDPERTAATFVEHAGDRWVLTGDFATVEADGTVDLLGRGSQCINSGGEKVFSEEVEMTLQGHPDVADVVVVGVPDERWGEAVGAVVQPRPGATLELDDIRAFLDGSLAGYKHPRRLVTVERIQRSPAGKADYRWARSIAEDPSRTR